MLCLYIHYPYSAQPIQEFKRSLANVMTCHISDRHHYINHKSLLANFVNILTEITKCSLPRNINDTKKTKLRLEELVDTSNIYRHHQTPTKKAVTSCNNLTPLYLNYARDRQGLTLYFDQRLRWYLPTFQEQTRQHQWEKWRQDHQVNL